MKVTVGICAYNEVGNIERAIRSIYSQTLDFDLEEVVVISSGSTDGTDEVVSSLMGEFPSLRLIRQERREGKNSAINLMLDNIGTELIVLLNADNTLADDNVLSCLIAPFADSDVGITGGHPVPTNGTDTLAGFASNLLWKMHHHISLTAPKIGELIAFRDIGTRLPTDTQSDEDILKMELESKGYRSVYVPDAVVLNRGPETVEDFMKQRTRVNIGEIYMRKNHGYVPPTWNKKMLFTAFLDAVREMGFHPIMSMRSVMLELRARTAARIHVDRDGGDKNVWDQVTSTKRL